MILNMIDETDNVETDNVANTQSEPKDSANNVDSVSNPNQTLERWQGQGEVGRAFMDFIEKSLLNHEASLEDIMEAQKSLTKAMEDAGNFADVDRTRRKIPFEDIDRLNLFLSKMVIETRMKRPFSEVDLFKLGIANNFANNYGSAPYLNEEQMETYYIGMNKVFHPIAVSPDRQGIDATANQPTKIISSPKTNK